MYLFFVAIKLYPVINDTVLNSWLENNEFKQLFESGKNILKY